MQARARYFGGVGGRAGGGVEVGVVRGGGAGACGAVLGGLAKLDVVFGGGAAYRRGGVVVCQGGGFVDVWRGVLGALLALEGQWRWEGG